MPASNPTCVMMQYPSYQQHRWHEWTTENTCLRAFLQYTLFLSFVGNVFVDLSNKIPILFFTQYPYLNYTLYHYHLLGMFGTTGHAEPLVQKYLTFECFALHTTLRSPRRQIPRILISTALWTNKVSRFYFNAWPVRQVNATYFVHLFSSLSTICSGHVGLSRRNKLI